MYIAFKWLLGLTLIMWCAICGIDIFIKTLKTANTGIPLPDGRKIYKNLSISTKVSLNREAGTNKMSHFNNHCRSGIFFYAIMCATGCFIFVINSKKKLILNVATNITEVEACGYYKYLKHLLYLKHVTIIQSGVISKYFIQAWGNIQRNIFKSLYHKPTLTQNIINRALLKNLKDVSDEKKNLSLLLAASILENRNIKFNIKLNCMAKEGFVKDTEETEKKMEQAQLQNMNYQHLYFIAFQKNIHLQARIKKLTELKEDAEKNLISLVHEVCLSKNKKLMAYCSRFVVQTKDKILRSDMEAEIQQFLRSTYSKAEFKTLPDVGTNTKRCSKSTLLNDSNSLRPLLTEAPKLVGLPGENIWTVKDKDGFIEKLYEYDYTIDFDNGDTISRIREYSVYHDKDCFFENINSRTILPGDGCGENFNKHLRELGNGNKVKNERFLTGSKAFQIFLKNSKEASTKIPISYD